MECTTSLLTLRFKTRDRLVEMSMAVDLVVAAALGRGQPLLMGEAVIEKGVCPVDCGKSLGIALIDDLWLSFKGSTLTEMSCGERCYSIA